MGIQKMITSTAFKQLDEHMPKVITPKSHGVVDYISAATFLIAGLRFLKSDKRAGAASLLTGAALLAEALVTDYPLGVKPLISFEVHGRLDHGFVLFAVTAPQTFGFKSSAATWFFRANAAADALIVSMTDFTEQPARAGNEPIPIREARTAAS